MLLLVKQWKNVRIAGIIRCRLDMEEYLTFYLVHKFS